MVAHRHGADAPGLAAPAENGDAPVERGVRGNEKAGSLDRSAIGALLHPLRAAAERWLLAVLRAAIRALGGAA